MLGFGGSPTRPRAIAVAAAALVALLALGPASAGASVMASAAITDQDGLPLNFGGSTTPFGVGLPGGAKCPGDTAHDGYRVVSFLVPGGTDLGGITFGVVPSTGFGLVERGGVAYAAATQPGTGVLDALPRDFEWAALLGANGAPPTVETLLQGAPNGAWDGGVACVDVRGHQQRAWLFHVVFTASAADPNGFVWTVVPDVPENLPEGPLALAFPAVAVAVIGTAALGRRRRHRRARASTHSSRRRPPHGV